MKNPFKKGKDEVAAKRKSKAKVPYVQCGHRRSYRAPNGSTITVICQKTKNHRGGHD